MTTLFEEIGGRPTLVRVHKIFYDKVYAHPWLGLFFEHIDQELIEDQQTDFLMRAMGGPSLYCGKLPVAAHKNMFISAELFDLRHELLAESLAEAGVSEASKVRWLRIDAAFRGKITKRSPNECERAFATDEPLIFADPAKSRAS